MNKVLVFLFFVFPFAVGFAQVTLKTETNRRGFRSPEVDIDFGTYHTLIIAVQNYDDKRWDNPGPTIEYARRLKQVLTERYTFNSSNVTFLQDPTGREILDGLENLRQRLTDNDNLLICYVGLGSWLAAKDQGYWIPSDASNESTKGWISNETIAEYVKTTNAKHTLVIADARIGANDPLNVSRTEHSDSALAKMNNRRSRRAISGNTMKDILETKDFLQTLLQILQNNLKPRLSESQISIDLGIVKGISGQTPVYGVIRGTSDEGGEFIFVRR